MKTFFYTNGSVRRPAGSAAKAQHVKTHLEVRKAPVKAPNANHAMNQQTTHRNSVASRVKIIAFPLIPAQKALLAPILRAAGAERRNVVFLATAAPNFQDGKAFWRLQVCNISGGTNEKLRRLLAAEVEL